MSDTSVPQDWHLYRYVWERVSSHQLLDAARMNELEAVASSEEKRATGQLIMTNTPSNRLGGKSLNQVINEALRNSQGQ